MPLAEGLCILRKRLQLPHPLELSTLIEAIIEHQTHMSSKNAIFLHGRSWCRAGACRDPTRLYPILHAFFCQRSQRNANLNFSIPYGTLHTRGLALMLCLLLW